MSGFFRLVLLAVAVLGIWAPAAWGQDEQRGGVERVGVEIQAGADVTGTRLDRYWRSGPVANLNVVLGGRWWELAASGAANLHRARGGEQSDFTAIVTGLGWGPSLRLPGGVRWTTTVGAGIYTVYFPGAEGLAGGLEHELSVTAASSVGVPVGSGWSVVAAASGLRVFTQPRIGEGLLMAGVRKEFGAPGWLVELLD